MAGSVYGTSNSVYSERQKSTDDLFRERMSEFYNEPYEKLTTSEKYYFSYLAERIRKAWGWSKNIALPNVEEMKKFSRGDTAQTSKKQNAKSLASAYNPDPGSFATPQSHSIYDATPPTSRMRMNPNSPSQMRPGYVAPSPGTATPTRSGEERIQHGIRVPSPLPAAPSPPRKTPAPGLPNMPNVSPIPYLHPSPMHKANTMGGDYHEPIPKTGRGFNTSPSGMMYNEQYEGPFHNAFKRSFHGDTPAQKKAKKMMNSTTMMTQAQTIGAIFKYITEQKGSSVTGGGPSEYASQFGSGGAGGIGAPESPNIGTSAPSGSSGSSMFSPGGLTPGGGLGGGTPGAGGGSGSNAGGGGGNPRGPPAPGAGGNGDVGQKVAGAAQAEQQASNTVQIKTGQSGTYSEGKSEYPDFSEETFGHETQNKGEDVLQRESKGEAPVQPYGEGESQTGMVEKTTQPDTNRTEPITDATGSKQNPATANSIVGASELVAEARRQPEVKVRGTAAERANAGQGEISGYEFSGPYDYPARGTSNMLDSTLTSVGSWRSKPGDRVHSVWRSTVTNRGAPSKKDRYYKYTSGPWGGTWKQKGVAKQGGSAKDARMNYFNKVESKKQGANWMNSIPAGTTMAEHLSSQSSKMGPKWLKYQRKHKDYSNLWATQGNEIKNSKMYGSSGTKQM